jgi:energy-coupling factor transport system permease protein
MGPTVDLYIPRRSWLHRLDPRSKLAFVIVGSAVVLSLHHILFLLAYLAGLHICLLSARIPPNRIRWVWDRMLPITVLIVLLWPLFDPMGHATLLQIWRIRITSQGVLRGIGTALRVNALAFSFFVLLFSTEAATLVRGLVKLGMPYTWGLTLAIALRYIPTFYGIYVSVTEAQQARGWIVGRGGFVARLRSYLPVLVAVLIISLRMTDRLTMALAARGLGAGTPRSTFKTLHFSRSDAAALVLMALAAGLLLVARWAYGWGASPW